MNHALTSLKKKLDLGIAVEPSADEEGFVWLVGLVDNPTHLRIYRHISEAKQYYQTLPKTLPKYLMKLLVR